MSLAQPRGIIYDKTGVVPLVCNVVVQSACIFPQQMVEKPRTMAFLKKFYPSAFDRLTKNSRAQFLWIDRHLSPQKAKAFKAQGLKDIQLIDEPKRIYPRGDLAAVIGFTDIDGKGIAGLEQEFDAMLAGKAQHVALSRDAREADLFFQRRVIHRGISGKKLCLTIDAATQYYVFQELKKSVEAFEALSGAAMVIDPETGKIEAMATYPTFDQSSTGELSDLSVTKNKAITECFELGSVMKAFTCLAALDEGVVDLDEIIDCKGKVTWMNGIRVENWKSVNEIPFREVIKNSSNVGTAQMGIRLHPTTTIRCICKIQWRQ
jgi:cell division protein FtsI (penicillin-binding protein 3)